MSAFSLPTQRCFCIGGLDDADAGLFSAYAEVFPVITNGTAIDTAFLCLRRGVSECSYSIADEVAFSLPTQRCF